MRGRRINDGPASRTRASKHPPQSDEDEISPGISKFSNSRADILIDEIASAVMSEIMSRPSKRERSESTSESESDEAMDYADLHYASSLSAEARANYKREYQRLRKLSGNVIPLRYSVLDSLIPDMVKARCLEYVNRLNDEDDSTSSKRREWLNTVLRVPLGKYAETGVGDPAEQLRNARASLEKVVHGNLEAKETLMGLVAQAIRNPLSRPPVIGLVGPPGVGKTTLARYGIAEALGRPFRQISCGGLHDVSSLRGHSFTWEGGTHGAIAGILIDVGCMNPIILLDEIDKIGDTRHGEEVQSLLIHLLDPTQNCSFQDEYMAGLDLDLSRAIFVLSLNDESRLSPILRDRVHFVHMESPSSTDKVLIAKRHLVPEALRNVGVDESELTFSSETLQHAVRIDSAEEYGVRHLARAIEGCVRRYNLMYLTDQTIPHVPRGIITPSIYAALRPKTCNQSSRTSFMYL